MRLNLVERYIFRKALIALIAATGGLVGVVWVVRAVQQVDVLLSKGQGIVTYLQMTTLGVPTLMAGIIPLGLLIALCHTISNLNNDSELVVLNAAGASVKTLLRPFLALSLAATIVVYTLHLWVGPTSMSTLRDFVTKVRADLISIIIQDGKFQDVGRGVTFHVASRAPGGELRGVFILDGRNPKETFTYLAKRGTVSKVNGNSFLVLQDGQIQRLSRENDNLSVIRFNSYAFNLTSFSPAKKSHAGSFTEVSTYHLFYPNTEELLFKNKPGDYRAALHTRLTGGLYCLMIMFLVLAFAASPRTTRNGGSWALAYAATTAIVLRAIAISAEGSLRIEANMVYLVWGIPVLTISLCLYLLATGRQIGLPARAEDRMEDLWKRTIESLSRWGLRVTPNNKTSGTTP